MLRSAPLLLLLAAAEATAQTSGAVRLVGSVREMVSVRFHSDQSFGTGVTGSNAATDGRLDYTLDLGQVGVVPGRDNGLRGGAVNLILRSNTPYLLSASVVAQGFGSRPDEMQLSDIGFGLPRSAIAPSGDKARSEGTQHLDTRFDSDPIAATVRNGAPVFDATLEDLQGGAPLLRGDRISYGGGLQSPTNGLVVSTRYAVLPQYFRGNSDFEATVVYTISSP